MIARRIGLDQRVCDVAAERLERREGELDELMGDVRSARMAAEETRKGAEQELARARARTQAVEERAKALEERSEQLEREAQKGIEERMRDAMRTLERARSLLDQLPGRPRRP